MADDNEALLVTYLEMRSPAELRPKRGDDHFRVDEIERSDWRFNRDLYMRVGDQWRWFGKRTWSDKQWQEYAGGLRTFAGYYNDELAGYYELRRDNEGAVEIEYFGLLPEFIGRGLGGPLLTSAIESAWQLSPRPPRVWVHTCNRDHPRALANYTARGMIIYETADTED